MQIIKVYVFYSLTHNKFIIKYSTGVNSLEVGSVNQYQQVLVQIIELTEKSPKKFSLKYTIKKFMYISRINKFYRESLKEIKQERRRQYARIIQRNGHNS